MTAFDTEMLEAAQEIINEFGVPVSWTQRIIGKSDISSRNSSESKTTPTNVTMSPPVEYDENWVGLDDLKNSKAIAFVRPEDLLIDGSVFQPQRQAALSFPSGQKFTVDKIVPMVSGVSIPAYALGLSG